MKYISILRGINVGGRRKILMADLKSIYEKLGSTNVITYIQSGNVIFDLKKKVEEKKFAQKIATAIIKQYDFEVSVQVKTMDQIKSTLTSNPFLKRKDLAKEKLHVTFLAEIPETSNVEKITAIDYAPDEFQIIGQDVFIHCEKYGKTKLNNGFFERKLRVSATTRNWKTINKLLDLAKE